MLKCNLDDKSGISEIRIEGTPLSLLADLTYLIRHVYTVVNEKDPALGRAMKVLIQAVVADDASPVWEKPVKPESGPDGVRSVHIRLPRDFWPGSEK